jgi:hypothetical protein
MTIAIIIGVLIVVGLIAVARIFKNMNAADVAKANAQATEAVQAGRTDRVEARQQGRTERLKARVGRWFSRRRTEEDKSA